MIGISVGSFRVLAALSLTLEFWLIVELRVLSVAMYSAYDALQTLYRVETCLCAVSLWPTTSPVPLPGCVSVGLTHIAVQQMELVLRLLYC